jgi:hypothetical protein
MHAENIFHPMEQGGLNEARVDLQLSNSSPPHEGAAADVLFDTNLLKNMDTGFMPGGLSRVIDANSSGSRELVTFPKPGMDDLLSVENSLRDAFMNQPKDYLAACIEYAVDVDIDWLSDLCSCFEVAETSGSIESLRSLFMIAKYLILASNITSLTRLVRDDVFEDIIGMLQYDPDIPSNSHKNHREFIREKLQFRAVMEITDTHVLEHLHTSFRLSYIRDSVLARLLDDYAFFVFNQTIQISNLHVINYFVSDPKKLIDTLIRVARETDDSLPVLQFVLALLLAGRGMMMDDSSPLLQAVVQDEFLTFIEAEISVQPVSMECLVVLSGVPSALNAIRRRCLGQQKLDRTSLVYRIIRSIHDSPSEFLVSESTDLLRTMLEPTVTSADASNTLEAFIVKFYDDEFLEELASPIIDPPDRSSAFRMQQILDLLSFCVGSHAHLAKAYFLRFGGLLKSIRLILTNNFLCKSKILQLAAIRLVRAFLWQKEVLFFRYLSAFNIPALVLQLLYQTRPDNVLFDGNMVYSACLEIVTFICVNNQTAIMEHLCKPGSESEQIIIILASDQTGKAHAELCQYMLTSVERLRLAAHTSDPYTIDDIQSRQSITSSRGRSASPRPLLVPVPNRATDSGDQKRDKRIRFSTSSP